MKPNRHPRRVLTPSFVLVLACTAGPGSLQADGPAGNPGTYEQRVAAVTGTPGFVALWDFVRREGKPARRFAAHRPPGAREEFALDAVNYIREFWDRGRAATYDDFPLLGRGPFGQAVRIRKEADETFRPLLLVPRARLHGSGLDIKGPGNSVTVIVWAVRESGNHALAGIWHEGTDLKQRETADIRRVERGMRQYALFAGLNKEGSATGHVSENGASSFGDRYARHKATTLDRTPGVPADAPAGVIDRSWAAFAFVFDNDRDEVVAYLDGVASERWQEDVRKTEPWLYRAWEQGQVGRGPGGPIRADPGFPADQKYAPPEDKAVSVKVLKEAAGERVELHEYRYTRVRVTLRANDKGAFEVTGRELEQVRLNPWWFPHDLYTPPDAGHGGPFTIGRVIHSSRSVGFTGYIGGVAVFDRGLSAREVARLSAIGRDGPIAAPRGAEEK